MNVSLTPQLEALVRRKIETGPYNNATEVVQEALKVLDERDRAALLKAALAVGDEQFARAEVTTWTPNTLAALIREADEEDRQGVPIRDDVQPPARSHR
jgi:antitoxin ParD1/3/4